MMTDPVADMLTRLRNAAQAGHRWADMPVSRLKVEVARILKESHFVFDYKVLDDGHHGVLRVYLKYFEGQPIIRHLERVSKPGRRRYVGATEIPRVRNGLGMAILSTSKGVVSDATARKEGIGGELLAVIW
ncbi:MAG: 30S ribosomal protein S8 [Gemmatimonadota bacterium]